MYSKVDARFWEDEKVLDLSIYAQHLMLYLLTCKHRNMFGCYRIPKGYMSDDTKIGSTDIDSALSELIYGGLIEYDERLKIVFVINFIKYNPIENPNQTKAAMDRLADMPDCAFFKTVAETLESRQKEHLAPLIEELYKRSPKGLVEPLREGYAQPVAVTVCSNSIQESSGGGNNNVTYANEPKTTTTDLPEELHDPDFAAVNTAMVTRTGGAIVNPTHSQQVTQWLEDVGVDLVLCAVEKGAERCPGRCGWPYIHGVLKGWWKDGLKTRELVEAHEKQREEAKARSGTSQEKAEIDYPVFDFAATRGEGRSP